MKRLALAAVLALSISAPGCSGAPGEPDLPGSANLAVPSTAASIIGDVTEMEGGGERRLRILVRQVPTRSAGHPVAWISVNSDTRILARRGDETSRAGVADVRVGARVWVWFEGPVAESYPVQATAGTVVIER